MKLVLLSILLLNTVIAFAQDSTELDRRNGFKAIKLASPIDSIKGAIFKKEFTERDEFAAKLYSVQNEEFKMIGEVNVRDIEVSTYKNLVYKIVVHTDKDPRVMKALEKSYGKAAYVVRTSSYNWLAPKLSLTFRMSRNTIELVYKSYPVLRKMMEDKGKKIDDIARDF